MKYNISYPQPIDIVIEYPMHVLAEYGSLQDLDSTWDDEILHVITKALQNHGFIIKNDKLDFDDTKLSYAMTLIANPPAYDLSCIAKELTAHGFGEGLTLKKATGYGTVELVYGA